MKRFKLTSEPLSPAQSVEKMLNIMRSMPEVWGPMVVTIEGKVVLVAKIKSHCAVITIKKFTSKEHLVSLLNTAWNELSSVLTNII